MTDTKPKQIVLTDVIKSESGISFLNDLRLLQITKTGDISFRFLKNNTVNVKPEITVTKHIHSIMLIARSKWFKKAYKEFLKHKDITKFELNQIIQKVYRNNENQLCFDVKLIDLAVFREFGMHSFFILNFTNLKKFIFNFYFYKNIFCMLENAM
jgi:hypothetical protein